MINRLKSIGLLSLLFSTSACTGFNATQMSSLSSLKASSHNGSSVLGGPSLRDSLGLQVASGALSAILSLPHLNTATSFAKFTLTDDLGRDMDVMDIAQENDSQFVGVYHTPLGGDKFCLRLATATSIDQAPWHYQTDIDCDYGSQGAIKRLPDGKYLLAFEKNNSGQRPYIRFLFFDSYAQLISNQASRSYSIPWNHNANAEGTPSFRWIGYTGDPDTMSVEIGFHYNSKAAGRDINAIGFMRGFNQWHFYDNTNLNALLSQYAAGNLGGRAFILFQGKPYTLVEAQTTPNDFSSWRLYLQDEQANTITPISMSTPEGSHSFANPKLTLITSGSDLMLVGTAFSFSGPSGGNHLYATLIPNGYGQASPDPTISGTPTDAPASAMLPAFASIAFGDQVKGAGCWNPDAVNGNNQERVYRFWQDGDRMITNSLNEGCGAGYIRESSFLFYTAPELGTDMKAVYRCYAPGNHFFSMDPTCEGFTTESVVGYLRQSQIPGTVPLYRLWNRNDGDHIISYLVNEGAAVGFITEGVVGYGPQSY